MRPLVVILGASLLGALAPAASGQRVERYEMAIAAGAFRSLDRALDPYGYTVSLSFVASDVVRLWLAWSDYRGSASGTLFVCDRYWPDYENCATEPARLRSRARVSNLAVLIAPPSRARWRFEFGFGAGLVAYEGEGVSRTSGRANHPAPGHLLGLTSHARVSRPVWGPVRAFASARLIVGSPFGGVTDAYDPFSVARAGGDVIVGLSTQLTLRAPRRRRVLSGRRPSAPPRPPARRALPSTR